MKHQNLLLPCKFQIGNKVKGVLNGNPIIGQVAYVQFMATEIIYAIYDEDSFFMAFNKEEEVKSAN